MRPRTRGEDKTHQRHRKLQDNVAIVTVGDSGIGRAIAIAFAKKGAHISVVYLGRTKDASETKRLAIVNG